MMPKFTVRMKATFSAVVEAPTEDDALNLAAEIKDINYGDADEVEPDYAEETDPDEAPYYQYDDDYRVVKVRA
jgi:hypothetical protein